MPTVLDRPRTDDTIRVTTTLPPQAELPTEPTTARRLGDLVVRVEDRIAALVAPYSLLGLRLALGTLFVWFGALKVFDVTPVADLVAGTVPFLDAAWFVPALGLAEVVLGVALVVGRHLTLICAALAAHLGGTFLVLVTQPAIAFQDGNPLLLTTIGEFVVKNIVLVAAALVLASRLQAPRR